MAGIDLGPKDSPVTAPITNRLNSTTGVDLGPKGSPSGGVDLGPSGAKTPDVSWEQWFEDFTFTGRLGFSDTYRGVSQITGINEDRMRDDEKELNRLIQTNPSAAWSGYVLGLLIDPASWAPALIPGPGWAVGIANKVKQVAKIKKLLGKAGKYVAASGKAAAGGAVVGSLGYLDEEAINPLTGEPLTRSDMALWGGVGGGVLGSVAKAGATHWSPSKNLKGRTMGPYARKLTGTPDPKYSLGEKAWGAIARPGASGAITGAALGGYAGYNSPNIQDFNPQGLEDYTLQAKLGNAALGALGGGIVGQKAVSKAPGFFIKNFEQAAQYVQAKNARGGMAKKMYEEQWVPIIKRTENLSPKENVALYKAFTGNPKKLVSKLEKVASGDRLNELITLAEDARKVVKDFTEELVESGVLHKRYLEKNIDEYLHRIYDKPKKAFVGVATGDDTLSDAMLKPRGKTAQISERAWKQLQKDAANPETSGGVGKTELDPGYRPKEPGKDKVRTRSTAGESYQWERWEPSPNDQKKLAKWEAQKLQHKKDVASYPERMEKYLEEKTAYEAANKVGPKPKKPKKPYLPPKPDIPVTIRRDWTEAERKSMGEVQSFHDSFKATGRLMSNNLASGKFLRNMANDVNVTSKGKPGTAKIDGKTVYLDHKLPDNRNKYGAMANQYVSKETAYDLMSINGDVGLSKWKATKLGRRWSKFNGFWKGTHTIMNPNVHMNNVISNVMHFDHGVTDMGAKKWLWLGKAAKALAQKGFGRTSGGTVTIGGKKEKISDLIDEADNAGVFGGHLTDELGQNEIAKLLRSEASKIVTGDSFELSGMAMNIANKVWRRGWAKTKKYLWDIPGNVYQYEDNIFRLAMYMAEKDKLSKLGASGSSGVAARKAREWFVDYENVPPALAFAREMPIPFLSYMYGIIPKLVETAVKNPIKIAKWSATLAMINEVGWQNSDVSYEERRNIEKMMEAQNPGYNSRWGIPGGGPTQIKLPDAFNPFAEQGEHGFVDLSRGYAGGDIFSGNEGELGQVKQLPGFLQPSGGALGAVLWPLLGIDQFKGRDIKNDDKLGAIIKQFIPNLPFGEIFESVIPGSSEVTPEIMETWAGNKIERARSGNYSETKDVHTLGTAWASMFGIKLKPVSANKLEQRIWSRYDKQIRNYDEKISQMGSELSAGGITEYAYYKKLENLLAKQRITIRQLEKALGN